MTGNIFSTVLAWLLTYAIHSTVLLALVWLLVRVRRWSPGASELLWKSAMVGAIVTASAQLALDVRPAGTLMLRAEAKGERGEALRRSAVSGERQVTTSEATTREAGSGLREATTSQASQPSVTTQAVRSQSPLPSSPFPLPASAVVAWALIALALGMIYIGRRLILVGRLGDRREVEDDLLLDTLTSLAGDAGVKRIPRLTSTSRISSPVALGLDEICVPETALTELDREQQRSLLAHELAHLARRDPVWLIAGSLIERVFWYQPLNRVANRQIAVSAEFLCDDWAVHRTGSGAPLARCLAQVAEWIQASPLGVPVAGMAEERSLLVTRVARLVEDVRPTNRSRRGLALASVAVLVATILVAPGVSGKTGSVLLADEVRNGESNIKSIDSNTPPASPSPSTTIAEVKSQLPTVSVKDTNADTGVVNALIARLDDENAEVRKAAAQSLGRLKDSRAIPGLIAALKDRDPRVRAAAAESLAEFEDARAIAPLADLLS